MDCHGVVQIRFGRTHFYRYGETLNHLIGSSANDVTAYHCLLRASDYQFDHGRYAMVLSQSKTGR